MEWIRVSETRLAKETSPIAAGKLFSKAGFAHKLDKVEGRIGLYSYIDARAANLSKIEVKGIGAFGGPAEPKTEAVKRAEAGLPTYGELVKAVENLNTLAELLTQENADLKEEIKQLRSITNPVNGMSERARKALLNAGRNLR